MKTMVKKRLAVLIAVALVLLLIPAAGQTVVQAAEPTDLGGHWAAERVAVWAGENLIRGYPDGTFRPDRNISRAEFMALVNNSCKFGNRTGVVYKDVPAGAWFAAEVGKAAAAGYIGGYPDGTVRPNNPITRAEAAAVVMRLKGLAPEAAAAGRFTDSAGMPGWSKGAIGAAVDAGILSGYPDGTFRADKPITRAEAVTLLAKALTVVHAKAGTYGPQTGTETVIGDLTVRSKDVTLRNTLVLGDLIIDKAVGDGNVTLQNVTVRGKTYVNGGGVNSVYFIDSRTGRIFVARDDGPVRIVVTGSTEIENLTLGSNVKVEETGLTGNGIAGITVEQTANGAIEIELKGVKVASLDIRSPGITVKADGGTDIEKLTVKADNVTVQTGQGTIINTLVADGRVSVTGRGTVRNAEVNVSGVSFETRPQNQQVATGVTPPTVTTGTTGGGSGGGSGTPAVSVAAISNVTMAVYGSTELTVTTGPADAAVTAVSSDTSVVSVSVYEHTVSLEAYGQAGSATVTVTASKSGYSNGTRSFTVTVMPDKPASFSLGTAKGSLYIDMSAFRDQYGNDIAWDNLVGAYGLDLANSQIYLTTDETVTSGVYATLEQMMTHRLESPAEDTPQEVMDILDNGGTVLYFDDEDLADIFAGRGVDGMFAGFQLGVHDCVYAVIRGSYGGEDWEISDTSAMPAFSTDTTLAVFSVGGEDVLALEGLEVNDPVTEPGATLGVSSTVDFTGIMVATSDQAARCTVTLNGVTVPVEVLPTQAVNHNNVIVVIVTSESGAIAYYKVTVKDIAAPSVDPMKFSAIDNEAPVPDQLVGAAGAVSEDYAEVKAYLWTDTDNDSQVDEGELGEAIPLGVSGNGGAVAPASIGNLAPGTYKFVITATDWAGNESAKDTGAAIEIALGIPQ